MANFSCKYLGHQALYIAKSWGKLVMPSVMALTALSSCINDDMDSCPSVTPKVSLKFDYTYNVKDADAFSAEVKNLNVYVFDQNGKYFDTYVQSSEKFDTGYTMDISDLNKGKYTFVCLARNKQYDATRADADSTAEDEMEFTFTKLTPGVSTMADLQEEMGKKGEQEGFVNNKNFTALYTARTTVDFQDKDTTSTLSLMKCTKTYRIVLLPYENDQTDFKPENFDVRIEGSAALLDCNGDKVENKLITYLPYNEECRSNYGDEKTLVDGQPVDQALVYDLASSRMFERTNDQVATTKAADGTTTYSDKRIIITDKRDPNNPKVVFNHSLPWFLALCGENSSGTGKKWGDQEYLDRQDHYVLMFYVPDTRDYNFTANMKVNGWVLNRKDTDLH